MNYLIQNDKWIITFLFITLSSFIIVSSNGAEILGIFPIPSYSHQQPMLAVSKALADKGHNVTILTPNPFKEKVNNLKQINLSFLYEKWEKMKDACILTPRKVSINLDFLVVMAGLSNAITTRTLENSEVKKFLRDVNGTKYDVILYESLMSTAFLGIQELIGNPPVIGISSLPSCGIIDEPMGNPSFPFYVPNMLFNHNDKMTFWERLKNVYGELYAHYVLHRVILPNQQKLLNKYFSYEKRTATELEFNKSLLILATDLATNYPKPVQPNTVYVGPLHIQQNPKPLPQDLKKWMDEAKEGVIYFSLGNNVRSTCISKDVIEAFNKAFRQFPKVRILWKWEADTKIPGQPVNVLTRKWFPQLSVLAHPNLKLFVSQVGLQSFQEAILNAVPILGIPVYADQHFNAKRLVDVGAGLQLDFNKITFEEVHTKLTSLLTEPRYKMNMVRLLSITKDKQMSAIDTAIWWIEYVIRNNGAPHLRPAVLDLPWYKTFMLDILLVVVLLLLLFFYLVRKLLRYGCSFIFPELTKFKKN